MRLPKVLPTAVLMLPLVGGAFLAGGSTATSAPVSSEQPVSTHMHVQPFKAVGRAAARGGKYVRLDAALAKKCMNKLRFAVQYGADNVASAVGLLEIETYSFEGQYASLKTQAIDMGIRDSYYLKADLRQLDNEIWNGLKMWSSGDRRKAVQWWNAALRTELLPALRTSVGAFRAKAEALSREARAALVALGKPWVINPDLDDRLEQAFDKVQGALAAAWKLATKRARR